MTKNMYGSLYNVDKNNSIYIRNLGKDLDLLQRNVSASTIDAWHLAKNVCSIDERAIRRTMHSA